MNQNLSSTDKAYLAGLLDGDGSIYVRAKPNSTYRYGFQIASYIVFFQSSKNKKDFAKIFSSLGLGIMRERKDGILEYTINRKDSIAILLEYIKPFLILKKKQANLLEIILERKERVENQKDFQKLLNLVDTFRNLNYSKKRKRHTLTP
ncbi:MAG: hypothetical protein A2919_01160 [Candidatus Spechtbacteria bacterium RIFCSPLOWO2_01_FULL_43_12]|uniref:Homing endonuclease LAGLIDADG domain-containing protein n=1 Tax=Candidatus Spechtbacteria bacterium RIFCSPLOWO2_01_FULL_43_12 TaxID=1802162 RepID=A0A1G2HDE9_9BACT|nr:MAG: hypothetical protein A2919_01160 [Candidatus Spechtbacteria bacterium RIFCSPLOWO2_01_FULL_43_12]